MKAARIPAITLVISSDAPGARAFLKRLSEELRSQGGELKPRWHPQIVKVLEARAKTAGQRAAVRAVRSIYQALPATAEQAKELLARLQRDDSGVLADVHLTPAHGRPSYVGAFEPASIVTPEFVGQRQFHLDPAPVGINARYAWQFAGADGAKTHLYVMEGGWSRYHPEIASLPLRDIDKATAADAAAGILPLASTFVEPATGTSEDHDHGAKTLSILVAQDIKPAERFSEEGFDIESHTTGLVGLVPNVARIAIGTQHDADLSTVGTEVMARAIAAAIHSAIANPTVLLVEREIVGASKESLGEAWDEVVKPAPFKVPYDSTFASYIGFILAIEFGVHVVMPMGNGEDQTLDGAQYALDKVYAKLRALYLAEYGFDPVNSQPIRVAAATRVGTEWKFNDPVMGTGTNYALVADCFGPVLVTCADQSATATFGQTSAASAVIAGAAASILGRARAKGVSVTPDELRMTFRLASNGQAVVDALPAQVIPDLRQIFYSKFRDYRPDLYFRKKSKLERWSPDLIIYPKRIIGGAIPSTRLLNQLYGEGSGRENDVIGPRFIIPGATYAIAARVRNRGASVARNPLFRFFSGPLAPARPSSTWNYLGSSWLSSVKTGRVAQVSPAVLWTAPSRGGAAFVAEVTCGGDNAQPDRTSVSTWPALVQLASRGDNLAFRGVPYVFGFWRDNYFVRESWIDIFRFPPRGPRVFELETDVPKGSLISLSIAGESGEEKWTSLSLEGGRARLEDPALGGDGDLQLQLRVEIPIEASKKEYSLAFSQKLDGVEVARADLIFSDPEA